MLPATVRQQSSRSTTKDLTARLPRLKVRSRNQPYTDLGNAQRLVARHGDDIRYCHAWRKWLIWDGMRWKFDATEEILRRAKETVVAFQLDAFRITDQFKRDNAVRHALRSQHESRLKAMVAVAQSEPTVIVTPDQLDADQFLLNCPNGTINLRTGKLRKARKADLITKLAPVEYDPKARAPIFDEFIRTITNKDEELAGYLQRVAGYTLSGSVREKAIFILYGGGDNGKTTFVERLRSILGDYAGQIPIESLMVKREGGIPNDIAMLRGLRLVTSSETEEGKTLAEAKVKLITGMGQIQGRYLYGEYFTFPPTFKIFIDANYRPEIRGTDDAIWNRVKMVPFEVKIAPDKIDRELPAKLEGELPGILAWAVRGTVDWQKRGLQEPKRVRAATEDYRRDMDVIGDFIDECCILGEDQEVSSAVLYKAYKDWCKAHDEKPVSPKMLGSTLKNQHNLKPVKVDGQRGWEGIDVLPDV
jgi:putative DNA primase/helicase